MQDASWQLFNQTFNSFASVGSGIAALMGTDGVATYSDQNTVAANKLASMRRSSQPPTAHVRRVDDTESRRSENPRILPAAAVYELALGLRERGWQYVQVLNSLPSLYQRCLGVSADADWPNIKSITSLSHGRTLCLVCGTENGLLVFGEAARLVAIAYHIQAELVFHEINGAHCLHLITSSLLDPEMA